VLAAQNEEHVGHDKENVAHKATSTKSSKNVASLKGNAITHKALAGRSPIVTLKRITLISSRFCLECTSPLPASAFPIVAESSTLFSSDIIRDVDMVDLQSFDPSTDSVFPNEFFPCGTEYSEFDAFLAAKFGSPSPESFDTELFAIFNNWKEYPSKAARTGRELA